MDGNWAHCPSDLLTRLFQSLQDEHIEGAPVSQAMLSVCKGWNEVLKSYIKSLTPQQYELVAVLPTDTVLSAGTSASHSSPGKPAGIVVPRMRHRWGVTQLGLPAVRHKYQVPVLPWPLDLGHCQLSTFPKLSQLCLQGQFLNTPSGVTFLQSLPINVPTLTLLDLSCCTVPPEPLITMLPRLRHLQSVNLAGVDLEAPLLYGTAAHCSPRLLLIKDTAVAMAQARQTHVVARGDEVTRSRLVLARRVLTTLTQLPKLATLDLSVQPQVAPDRVRTPYKLCVLTGLMMTGLCSQLRPLTSLHTLALTYQRLTEQDYSSLSLMSHLTQLTAQAGYTGARQTVAAVAAAGMLRQQLDHLALMSHLRDLDITLDVESHRQKLMPYATLGFLTQLTRLCLAQCGHPPLALSVMKLTRLEKLALPMMEVSSPELVVQIAASLPRLRDLDLSFARMMTRSEHPGDIIIRGLSALRPELEVLRMSGVSTAGNAFRSADPPVPGAGPGRVLPNVHTLVVSGARILLGNFLHLATLTQLRHLELNDLHTQRLTAASSTGALAALSALTGLTQLQILRSLDSARCKARPGLLRMLSWAPPAPASTAQCPPAPTDVPRDPQHAPAPHLIPPAGALPGLVDEEGLGHAVPMDWQAANQPQPQPPVVPPAGAMGLGPLLAGVMMPGLVGSDDEEEDLGVGQPGDNFNINVNINFNAGQGLPGDPGIVVDDDLDAQLAGLQMLLGDPEGIAAPPGQGMPVLLPPPLPGLLNLLPPPPPGQGAPLPPLPQLPEAPWMPLPPPQPPAGQLNLLQAPPAGLFNLLQAQLPQPVANWPLPVPGQVLALLGGGAQPALAAAAAGPAPVGGLLPLPLPLPPPGPPPGAAGQAQPPVLGPVMQVVAMQGQGQGAAPVFVMPPQPPAVQEQMQGFAGQVLAQAAQQLQQMAEQAPAPQQAIMNQLLGVLQAVNGVVAAGGGGGLPMPLVPPLGQGGMAALPAVAPGGGPPPAPAMGFGVGMILMPGGQGMQLPPFPPQAFGPAPPGQDMVLSALRAAQSRPKEPNLSFLSSLHNLQVLEIQSLTSSGACLTHLTLGMTALRQLTLEGAFKLEWPGIRALEQMSFPVLESFIISHCAWRQGQVHVDPSFWRCRRSQTAEAGGSEASNSQAAAAGGAGASGSQPFPNGKHLGSVSDLPTAATTGRTQPPGGSHSGAHGVAGPSTAPPLAGDPSSGADMSAGRAAKRAMAVAAARAFRQGLPELPRDEHDKRMALPSPQDWGAAAAPNTEQVSVNGLMVALGRSMPSLQLLSVDECQGLRPETLTELLGKLTQLRYLSLHSPPGWALEDDLLRETVSDESLRPLANLRYVRATCDTSLSSLHVHGPSRSCTLVRHGDEMKLLKDDTRNVRSMDEERFSDFVRRHMQAQGP